MHKRAATALVLGALVAGVCSVAPPQADTGTVQAASVETGPAVTTRPLAASPAPSPTASATTATTSRSAPAERPSPDPSTTPSPTTTEPPLPESVPVFEPRVVVDDVPAPEAATTIEGVAASATGAKLTASSRSATGEDQQVSVLVVDPEVFRSFTPEATANAPAVWERLRDGDLLITHSTGTALGAILGDTITLTGPGGSRAIRVGAFASTGAPPLADVVVAWEPGRDLGAVLPNTSIVAVSDGADEADVREALQASLGGTASVRERPATQQATGSLGSVQLEPFTYTDNGDGMITIDPAWVQRNISTIEIPGWGAMRCNNVILPQLSAAFDELRALGLLELLNDYGGCFVPRHILFNPDRALSRHAWGLAFDTNVATNGYGATPTLDMRIVDVFRRWGFKWGGDFSTPDGMHFELERIVRPA